MDAGCSPKWTWKNFPNRRRRVTDPTPLPPWFKQTFLKTLFSVICICVYIPHFRKTIFIDFMFIELMYHVYVFITHLSSPDIIKSLRGRKRLEQRVV